MKYLAALICLSFYFTTVKANSPDMPKKPIVYMLSGLGLDPAIFDNLKLDAQEVHHLEWITPKKKEKLADYAARIAEGIDTSQGKVVLIGHSFGGITMQEISKIVPTEKVILLSSIKSKKENPASFKFWLKAFPLYRLAGKKTMLKSFKSWGPKHGYTTPGAEAVYMNAVAKHEPYYFNWAIQQVCKWEKTGTYPAPIIHIHGTNDKTFPYRKIQEPVITVKDGSHVMCYTMGEKISALINQELQK